MTFSISVSGSFQNDENGKPNPNEVNRVRTAVQRLYLELQRAGVAVSSVSLGGPIGGEDAPKFASFPARSAPASGDVAVAGFLPREGRVQTGQPGAKDAITLSAEAGTTRTESQPEPAPTGPVTDKSAGVEVNTEAARTAKADSPKTTGKGGKTSTTTSDAGDAKASKGKAGSTVNQ